MAETTFDVLTEILRNDPDYFKDPWVYQFSNGRKFYEDDNSGIYEED